MNSDSFFWTALHPRGRGFADAAAYRRYIDRMRDVPRLFAEHQDNMRAGLARGFTPPAVTLRGRDDSVEAYLHSGEANPFYAPLRHFPPSISAAQRGEIESDLLKAIDAAIIPAYAELLDFLRSEYLPGARRGLAARDLPHGEDYYRAQIRAHTTLDLTPERIHEKGLEEVARIRGAMEAILQELDFSGNMADFFAFLRSDPQFYAETPDQLMGVSAYAAKRMDGRIHDVVGFMPRRRFTIAPVPPEIAPIYTAGRGGLSRCLMNTWNLPARPAVHDSGAHPSRVLAGACAAGGDCP